MFDVCVEIGGTHLRYALVDEKLQVIDNHRIKSAGLSDAEDKGAYLKSLIDPLLAKAFELQGEGSVKSISLSLASLMDRDRTICYNSPNIKGFDNLPLKAMLEEIWHIPVYMERDVSTSLLYEIWEKDLPRQGVVLGIYLGTGLGSAMAINGQIYGGASGSAAELGHIPVPYLEEECGCGKKGCIELWASGRRLYEVAKTHQVDVADIFSCREAEDEVKKVVDMCAYAAASAVTILDPVCLILGGGVMEMPAFPWTYFEERLRENLRTPNPRESLKILRSSGDPYAGVKGAALHAAACQGRNR